MCLPTIASQGYDVNPCRSRLHPAVTEAGIEPESSEELPVQEAYTPESSCFGCGPAAEDGLHLRSFRTPGGLEASVTLDKKYCAFPGIINGGIVSSVFDCHGNWTAAIALMDRGCLPKPPLTLTYEMLVTYVEPTPPDEPLIVRSEIVSVKDSGEVGLGGPPLRVVRCFLAQPHWHGRAHDVLLVCAACCRLNARHVLPQVGSKAAIQVDMSLHQTIGGHEKLLATASGIFKKLGALRAL